MKPRYEIHGFTCEGIVSGKLPFEQPTPAEDEALRQRAAKVLFAASESKDPFTLNVNSYTEKLNKARIDWVKQIALAAEKIDNALKSYFQTHKSYLNQSEDIAVLVKEGLLKQADLNDRWNNPYRIRWYQQHSTLDSAGPDGKWDTKDDFRGLSAGAKQNIMDLINVIGGMLPVSEFSANDRMPGSGIAVLAWDPGIQADSKIAEKAPPGGQPQVRLRQFFPETLYVNPSVITDERGMANVSVEMADSITTWRLQALASSQQGQLGSVTNGLKVFQDFFIDIDLPVALTQGDEISIPVAVYNYLPKQQTVKLSLETRPWFDLIKDEAVKSLDIGPSDIKVIFYRLRAQKIGSHSLTVNAQGSRLSDAIKRQIEVLPNGEERRDTWNDMLEGTVEKKVTIPEDAIAGASTILVKIYPGLLSQAIEGLDSMLRMPSGCFEQTSSMTYPNVLVMDYMKKTKQIKPEVQMKAEQYINVGYQRLLSFEVKGGGFEWFGNAPAHKVLTAYGLLEFSDMSQVHEVDPAVIARTQRWLAGQQQADGSWMKDQGGIAEGIINRQTDTLRTTAYIAWTLAESGYKGPEVKRALDYVMGHWREANDPYALAVIASAFFIAKPDAPTGGDAIEALAKLAVVEDKIAFWKPTQPTFTSAKDKSADIETTALATYALVKSGRHVDLTNKAITYLIRSKDSFGSWHTTQATVWALKALLLSLQKAAQQIDATVAITVNGKQAGSFRISQENYEVVRQVDAKELLSEGTNDVRIALSGKGTALYQIVAKYYMPWKLVRPPEEELLSISVDYDRKQLATDDMLTEKVRVVNNAPLSAEMVVVDLGVPPGFEVQAEDLYNMVEHKKIQKFTIAARQIIIYLDKLVSRTPLELTYRLRAKSPIKAATPASTVYRYYNPEIKATAQPVNLEVR
jgi:uncharacterized protein YfaS (alpha-2-macroglobulin family)